MTTPTTLPLGARLAAERAYTNLSTAQRRNPALVAEALLTAAAPFIGRSQGHLDKIESRDIFRLWLTGEPVAMLANRFGVTRTTITNHIRRHVTRTLRRIEHGTRISVVAMENQVSASEVSTALADWETRHGAAAA